MTRFALALMFTLPACAAFAAPDACSVSGTAYDSSGKPLRSAVVRLVDLQTQRTAFGAADANAAFAFSGVMPAGEYRLDVLSAPTVVTGTRIPTRSIVGMSPRFACGAGQLAREDVHAQVD